jgi:uncharacterized protein YndB with AHSA1/START domain
MANLQATQTENTLVLTKTFDAPRELVFEMFKNPDHLAKWWGPQDWPATIERFDFAPGGEWLYCMTGPDGTKAWGKATFQEIDEPNTLTYIDAFSDENGTIDESLPQGQVSFSFGETDGKTTLTMTGTYKSAEDAKRLVELGMVEGMTDTWNQLERLLQEAR